MDSSDEMKPDILIVDDDADFLNMLAQRLKTRGLEADTVNNGEEALEIVKGKNYNIVILDLVMPGMGGMEVLRTVKKTYPHLPVIVLTGQGTTEDAVQAMKEGALDYLEKPVEIGTLVQKILEARHKRLSLLTEEAKKTI